MSQELKQLPKFLDVNVRTLRKCPRCEKKHYQRYCEHHNVTTFNNGILEQSFSSFNDAGSTWQCLECNLYILQDGSWENSR